MKTLTTKTAADELNSIMNMETIDVDNIDSVTEGYLSTIISAIANTCTRCGGKGSCSLKRLLNKLYLLSEESMALEDEWTLESLSEFAKGDFQKLIKEN